LEEKGFQMKKVDTISCQTCNQVKPRADFTRLATLAQTRAWIRNPTAKSRLPFVSTVCNSCSKQVKRNSGDMSPSEYQKRLVNEGMHPLIIEELVKNRIKRGKVKLKAGALRALKIQRKHLYEPHVAEIQTVRRKVRQRVRYSAARNFENNAEFDRFTQMCESCCQFVMDNLRNLRSAARTPPSHWQKLIADTARAEIDDAFNALDGTDKARMLDVWQALQIPPDLDPAPQPETTPNDPTPTSAPTPTEPKPEPPAWMLF
jgi:hypothetical protein